MKYLVVNKDFPNRKTRRPIASQNRKLSSKVTTELNEFGSPIVVHLISKGKTGSNRSRPLRACSQLHTK